MINVLIIGLDELSKKIIQTLKTAKCNIRGFDLDVDKINFYKQYSLILNSSSTLLNDLLKESDIIILNLEYSKYEVVFRLLPFIKSEALIINTNIYKENIDKIKKALKTRTNNFIPCNFLLFPDNVIINYDTDAKMNFISKVSNFFKNIKIKTSVLNPQENNEIFTKLYQIPYLLDKVFFKNNEYYFVSKEIDYSKYNFFVDDIILNKKNILLKAKKFLSDIENIKNKGFNLELFDNINFKHIKTIKNLKTDINDEIALKILIEKIFIKTFITGDLESYLNLNYLNFDSINYEIESVKGYFLENKNLFDISLIILREKIINLISFIQFDDLPPDKFLKFLNNI